MKVELAGRTWLWPDIDTACRNYLAAHWEDALAMLPYVPEDRRKICIQAGGNFGVWPWLLAPHFERVLTFEPDPECHSLLVRNVEGRSNIEVFFAGLADRETQAALVLQGKNRGAQHLHFGEGAISCLTIDSLNLPGLDLLSLDIEGAEHLALEGAKRTINKFRPIIVVEDWREPPKAYRLSGKKYPGHAKHNYNSDLCASQWLVANGYRSVARIGQDEVFVS